MIAIFPETLACVAKGDMEELAILIRRYFGDDEKYAPSPDIKGLLERVGLTVESITLEGYGALVAKDEHGTFTTAALVSPLVDRQTERFLLAHMLGHYFIDIQPLIARGEMQKLGFRERTCPQRRYIQGDQFEGHATFDLAKEVRADLFAGALLMPLGMVKRAMETLKDREKVARFFDVSLGCLQRRLSDIGLNGEDPSNFLEAEAVLSRESKDISGADEVKVLEPPAEPLMPRAFAASTYGQTARTTGQTAPVPKVEGRPVGSRKPSGAAAGRSGMQRIREIASQLDKSSPSKNNT